MVEPAPATEASGEVRSAHYSRLSLAAIVVAATGGVILRFATSSPLWLDEALSVNVADLEVSDMVSALRHDGHPILYYLVLGWWIDVFGRSDTAVRALSGVFSLAAVPALLAVARRRYGPDVARHTLGLALAAPFLLRYGTETRMYSLVVLLVAVGWLTLDRALEKPTLGRLVQVALVAAALVHTHYWTFWLLATVGAALAWRWRQSSGAERDASLRSLLATAGGGATIIFWAPVLLDQARHTGTPWAGRARPAEVVVETIQALGGGRRFEPMLLGIVLVTTIVLGATFSRRDGSHLTLSVSALPSTIGPVAITLGTLALGAAASIANGGAFEGRHAAVIMPMLIVLSARGSASLGSRAAPIALLLLVSGGLFVGADDARRDRSQGREVATVIDGFARPGDVVAFCPDQLSPAVARYLDFEGDLRPYPGGYDPGLVDWHDYLDRIAGADPVDFAADLHSRAGTHAIFLVFDPSYRGFEGRCERVVDSLTDSGRTDDVLVNARPIFQPMFLRRLSPAS